MIMKKYTYKGKTYRVVMEYKVKINNEWVPAIIYECLYNNPEGMVWVRTKDEFLQKFQPLTT